LPQAPPLQRVPLLLLLPRARVQVRAQAPRPLLPVPLRRAPCCPSRHTNLEHLCVRGMRLAS